MDWVKIDLHVHSTDSSFTGSNISSESDLEKLLILQKHRVRVTSFADHDNFYLDSYLKRQKIIKEQKIDILLLPGIEVNLRKFNNQIGQSIFIFNPENDLKKLHQLTTKEFRFNNNKFTYEEAINLFNQYGFDFMVFPHAGKAQDNMNWEDIKDKQIDALDVTDFNNKNKKKILKENDQIPVVYFSDTHTWSKYPQYGKYCSYIQVEDSNNLTYREIKNNIKNNKLQEVEIW
ncbi:MAG: PHP domain-containing protein [Metamycoplasmataceae bacterium]